MTDFDPRDRFDIPDDREPDTNIPEAVCDVQTEEYECPDCTGTCDTIGCTAPGCGTCETCGGAGMVYP